MLNQSITVEVLYALAQEQTMLKTKIPQGSTLIDAIINSGVLERYPEIDLDRNKLGIFNKLSSQDVVLRDRDRVEIYRPLIADSKEVRKKARKKTSL